MQIFLFPWDLGSEEGLEKHIRYGRTENKGNFTEVLRISELKNRSIGFDSFENGFALKREVCVCACGCMHIRTEIKGGAKGLICQGEKVSKA